MLANCMPDDFAREIAAVIPDLRRYARSLTDDQAADDLVQAALVRGMEKIHLWQPGTNLRAWLFTVLHNRYVDNLRLKSREGVPVELPETHPSLVCQPLQSGALLLRDLRRALERLSETRRRVVLLVGLEGERYDAVALQLDIPIGTVRSRASRGRQLLRQSMDGEPRFECGAGAAAAGACLTLVKDGRGHVDTVGCKR